MPRRVNVREKMAGVAELPAMRQSRDADLARMADDPELQALLQVVVVAVLRIDDPNVHVEGARQERQLVDLEARDAFLQHRHRNAVHEGVGPVHAGAVVAIDVDPEDGVGHAAPVSEGDLDHGRLPRLEDRALLPVGPEDPRPRDLDLLRAPPRADLAPRGALALL